MMLLVSVAMTVFPSLGLDNGKSIPAGEGGGKRGSPFSFFLHVTKGKKRLTLSGDERHTNIWLSGFQKSAGN